MLITSINIYDDSDIERRIESAQELRKSLSELKNLEVGETILVNGETRRISKIYLDIPAHIFKGEKFNNESIDIEINIQVETK